MTGGRLVPYFRLTWWEHGKRREKFIRLPEDVDSLEFDKAYWDIRSGKSPALQKPAKDTWAELAAAYRAHPKFTKKAVGTRRSYDRVINDIVEKNGRKSVASLTRAQVRAIHAKHADTPRKADWYIQIISLLCNFAKNTLDWKVENPAEGIELYGSAREFEPWPDWMIAKLEEAPEVVRTAAELILGTGQRPSAAICMRHDQFHGETMTVIDDKSDAHFEVYAPPQLRAYIGGLPKRGAYILSRNLTQPIGYSAIEKAFRAWRAGLGDGARPYVLHGLRKLAIVRLAEAGCTDAQIQAITNQSPEMVAFYRKRANRKILSRAAHRLVEQNKSET
jgi:DNA-binding CsgD family transcriptional regulator